MSKRKLKKLVLALVVAFVLAAGSQSDLLRKSSGTLQQNQPGLYEVEESSDGDTIIVNMNGRREIIRLIGIDTPEINHPDRPIECFAREASEYTRRLLVGKKVRLEADPLNTNRDRYERLLRYVYLSSGQLAQKSLISEGYGFSYTQFPFSKTVEFNAYEEQAKAARKGLWGSCQVTTEPSGLEKTNPATP